MTDVAAIYFPSWHVDPRRETEKGSDWTEWELVKAAVPRFPGHAQPIEPMWGYIDEADPCVMQRSCDTARLAGIDAFLWDWYWYDDGDGSGDYLNRPLDQTYLMLESPGVDFALMWANHDWNDVFPACVGVEPTRLHGGGVSPAGFRTVFELVVDRYLGLDRYWRVNGAAWFTVYRLDVLIEGLGGMTETQRLLEQFRAYARSEGRGELHLNALDGWQRLNPVQLAELGLDSVGHYNWASVLPLDQGLEVPYGAWRERARAQWQDDSQRIAQAGDGRLAYVPNVTMGWDSTARVSPGDELVVSDWPFLPVATGNDPDSFFDSCRDVFGFARELGAPAVVVNAWNEWTEGSYLEPDRRHGFAYIEAIRRAKLAVWGGVAYERA